MAHKYMKSYSKSLMIREMQVNTTVNYYFTLTGLAKMSKLDNAKCLQGCGEAGPLAHHWWGCRQVR